MHILSTALLQSEGRKRCWWYTLVLPQNNQCFQYGFKKQFLNRHSLVNGHIADFHSDPHFHSLSKAQLSLSFLHFLRVESVKDRFQLIFIWHYEVYRPIFKDKWEALPSFEQLWFFIFDLNKDLLFVLGERGGESSVEKAFYLV